MFAGSHPEHSWDTTRFAKRDWKHLGPLDVIDYIASEERGVLKMDESDIMWMDMFEPCGWLCFLSACRAWVEDEGDDGDKGTMARMRASVLRILSRKLCQGIGGRLWKNLKKLWWNVICDLSFFFSFNNYYGALFCASEAQPFSSCSAKTYWCSRASSLLLTAPRSLFPRWMCTNIFVAIFPQTE